MKNPALASWKFPSSLRNAAIIGGLGVMLCLPSMVSAQGTAPVFKSGGEDRSAPGRKPPPAPSSLNGLDLKNLVGSDPGTSYVKLTVRQPSVTNRGALVFISPKLVEGGENYATWGPPGTINMIGSEGGLALWLRPATGKKYLIDCAVESPSKDGHFSVSGPAGNASINVQIVPGGQHLTFMLYAADNKWQHFQITGVGMNRTTIGASAVEWTFYSCEVTNL